LPDITVDPVTEKRLAALSEILLKLAK